MKNSEIAVAALMALIMFSYSKAEEIKIDFDGRSFKIPAFDADSRDVYFETLKENMDGKDLPEAKAEKTAPETVVSGINTDYSLMNAINYCEKNKIGEAVTENLKKLLVHGTEEEKTEFLYSDKYFFPKRLRTFRTPDFEDALILRDKGYQQYCWEDNCRMEKVCGVKKSCSRACEMVGIACLVAGTAITQYYTGGTCPTASVAVGAVAQTGCNWACDGWMCEDIDDCHYVQKCDSHCENIWVNDNADQINPNTGQIIYN